jgi:phosphatidylserine/phosphatidylglycerophosphate/cardiolipin synthase-like enzyme
MTAKDSLDHRKIMDWVRPDIVAHGNVIAMLGTTFELDPTFFDSDYLPTFLGLGAWEDTSWTNRVAMQRALANTEATVVMMDARRFRGRPRSLHIEVVPVVGSGGMKLHAKVLIVVQERAVRLLVGSANLTDSGYRYNREVALPIIATAQTPQLSSWNEGAIRCP